MGSLKLPSKPRKKIDHLTIRVPHDLMMRIREFRRLARVRGKDSVQYLTNVIEEGIEQALEALAQEDESAA